MVVFIIVSNLTEGERTGVQPYIWESTALEVRRNSAMLQSLRHADLTSAWINGQSHATTVPNEYRATNGRTYLRASSAAQMLGDNEDSYFQVYIQTQSTGVHARHC